MDNTVESFYIEKNVSDQLEELICSSFFPWYYNDATVGNDKCRIHSNSEYNGFQLIHGLYKDHVPVSSYFNEIVPPLTSFKELQFESYTRIKINLNVKTHNEYVHLPIHKDVYNPIYTSMIYYVNNSDGDTLFFDDHNNIINRVTPEKGKVVIFRSNIPHAAEAPVKNKNRIIINFIGLRYI